VRVKEIRLERRGIGESEGDRFDRRYLGESEEVQVRE
jgi:hypothetical protein